MSNTPINPLDYATPNLNRCKTRWWLWVPLSLLAVFLLIAILLPSLNHPRPANDRVKCASNLRQIGQAILLYTHDHAGQYPDSLGILLLNEDMIPPVFICPCSNDSASAQPTTREQAAEINAGKHCSYIYLGRGMTTNLVAPHCVIGYEPLANHSGDGMNVLFGDGHVEFIDKIHAASILTQVAAGKTVVRYPVLPTTTRAKP